VIHYSRATFDGQRLAVEACRWATRSVHLTALYTLEVPSGNTGIQSSGMSVEHGLHHQIQAEALSQVPPIESIFHVRLLGMRVPSRGP